MPQIGLHCPIPTCSLIAASISSTLVPTGFSPRTCFPALRHLSVISSAGLGGSTMKTASIESDPMMASRPASPKWTSALLCHIDNDRVLAVSSLLDHTASTAIFENFQRSPSRMGTYVFWAKVPPPRMAHRMGVRMPSWVPSWEPFVAAMRLFFLCRARRARVLNFIGEVLRPRVTRELDLTIAAARLTTEHCHPNQSAMRELGSAPALVPPGGD